jgi:tRNA 2-thiocytidine biosynthesis protein TtcA
MSGACETELWQYLSPRDRQRVNVFAKKVGRGINRFDMIEEGDRILIAVSGGKDSLALSAALAARRQWVPRHYECLALLIDWREFPLPPESLISLSDFYAGLGIPLKTIQADMMPATLLEKSRKPFNCYICSRNRRRILFREAEKEGISTIALGHHLDDIVETTLLNLCFRGEFSTMMPVQKFFDGRMRIIRPMCEVEEKEIRRLMRHLSLPVCKIDCPRWQTNQRQVLKEMLKVLKRSNKRVKENIYQAPWNINRDYLPVLGRAAEGGESCATRC